MDVLNSMLSITIYSGVIFAATMLLKKLFKNRMSPLMHFAVWTLLIARLLIPVTIASPVHLIVLPAQEPRAPVVVEPQASFNTALHGSNTVHTTDAAAQEPVYHAPENAEPADSIPAAPAAVQPAQTLSLQDILLIVWASGTVAFMIYLAAAYAALRRETHIKAALPSKKLVELFEKLKAELAVKGNVKLLCQYRYGMPALMFPGTILMPFDSLVTMDDEQVKFALRHELTHYKRGDHVINVLLSLLLAVYWFNPFLWLAFRQIHLDMETACDNEVVRALDISARSRYAKLIVGLFAQPRFKTAVLGVAQGSAKKVAERRVRGIFMDVSSRKGVKFVSVLIAAVLFVACFTTACQPVTQAAAPVSDSSSGAGPSAQQKSAQPSESAKPDTGFNIASLKVPSAYKFKTASQDGRITVDANAAVTLPNVDKMPSANVVPGEFTQQQVSGVLKYLYGDTPYYEQEYTLTKDNIQQQIEQIKKDLESGSYGTDPYSIDSANKTIKLLQSKYAEAPDVAPKPKPSLSDGIMKQDPIYPERSEISAFTGDADTGKDVTNFSCISCKPFVQYGIVHSSDIYYIDYLGNMRTYHEFTLDKATRLYGDTDIPADKKDKLGITLEDAKAKADGLFAAAGDSGMQLAAAYLVDDHGPGNVDDYTGPAKNYAIELFYERTLNGAPILAVGANSFSNDMKSDYLWAYENISVIVSSRGIIFFSSGAPGVVTATDAAGANLISFDQAAGIFEKNIVNKYEPNMQIKNAANVNVQIDSVKLGLFRIKQKTAEGKVLGKYVPVWAFYGTSVTKLTSAEPKYYGTLYDDGSIYKMGPYIVYCVNALNGSVIDISKGY